MSQPQAVIPIPDTEVLDLRLRLLLSGLLLAAYMFVYLGQPGSIDGAATLAVTSSFLKYGTPDMNIMGSSEALLPPLARMGSFGADGLLYAKKGVTPSLLLLPLVALSQALPFLPVRAATALLNPATTTLTAILLYTFARWLDFRPRTAFVTALVYGLATYALIYTTTLFGEPIASLLLLIALMAGYRYRQNHTARILLASGLALGLAVGVNLSYMAMAPLVGLYAFGLNPHRWPFVRVVQLAAPFLLVVVLLLVYNLARFGSLLESGYNFAEGEGFTTPFGVGLFGLLLSPYRGMIWYNPVLLLSIPGAVIFQRRNAPLLWVILAVIVAQIASYASWWSWHGGVVWGPRFLIPVTPLLALLLLPVIERVPQHRPFTLAFALLGTLSLLIQLAASLFSFIPHIIYLYQHFASNVVDGFFIDYDPEIIYRVDASPVIAQFRLALSGQELQPVMFQNGDVLHALFVLIILASAILAYHYAKQTRRAFVAVAIMAATMMGVAARQQGQLDIERAAQQALTPADLIVAAGTDYDDELIELKTSTRVITTNAPTQPDDPLAAGLWEYAMQQRGLIWFITWFPPTSVENWQERDLWQRSSFVRETLFQENRALLFDLDPPAQPDRPGGWHFGPIQLADYGIRHDPDGIRVTLNWTSENSLEQNNTWFVHLIDTSGQIIQQQDRAPQGGYTPTSTWQSGDSVVDYLFFPLAQNTDTSGWQIRVGWVQPNTNERLEVKDPTGRVIADGFILLPIP